MFLLLFFTNIFQVMAESTNSSLVVPKEHPNLCYLLSSCSRCGNNCVDMNPMMTKDILWQNETLQAYGWGGWVHVGPPQLPRRQVLHPLHGRLSSTLPRHTSLQVPGFKRYLSYIIVSSSKLNTLGTNCTGLYFLHYCCRHFILTIGTSANIFRAKPTH